jgi:hypothetical protein
MTGPSSAEFYPFCLAMIVLVLMGFFLMRLVCPRELPTSMAWAFAPAVGAGVCALIDFLFRRPMFTVEPLVLGTLAAIWIVRNGIHVPDLKMMSWRVPAYVVLIGVLLGYVFSQSMQIVTSLPYGGWDGFAIWNSHARFLFRDSLHWASHILNSFHPDYPLLVPLLNVRIWRYAGEVPDLGGWWAVLFAFSGVGILCAVVAEMRGSTMAALMVLVLIGTPHFLTSATAQEADAPLAVFILAALALIVFHFERMPDRPGIIAIAGFMVGCAAWTKNEGMLFLAAASASLLVPLLWQPAVALKRLGAYLAGLIVPLAVVLSVKSRIGAENDIFAGQHYEQIMARVMNLDRYRMISNYLAQKIWTFGAWSLAPIIPVVALVLLTGIHRQAVRTPGWIGSVAILVLVACGYFAIYVITPLDLKWHIETSMDRLMLHMWPSALMLAAVASRTNVQRAV